MTVGYGIGFSHLELILVGSTFSTSLYLKALCVTPTSDPPMTNNFQASVTIALVVSMVVIDVVEIVVSMVVAVVDSKTNQQRQKIFQKKNFLKMHLIVI